MRLNKKLLGRSLYKITTILFLIGYNFAPSFLAIDQLKGMVGEITPVAAADGPYTISSTSGIWTKVEGTSNYSGVNTSEIRWGTGNPRSGLKFNKAGTQTFDADQKFLIGDLTHMNWPVSGGTADSATLKVTLNFSQPPLSPNPTFSYKFNIKETSNNYYNYWNCPGHAIGEQLSKTPCDDVITFPSAYGQEVFTIGDMKYTLKIDGFQSQYPTGNPVSKFITEERKDNVAYLVGHLSSILMERPAISIVKKVNGQDANTLGEAVQVNAGETVNFTYIVQNTGNVKLTNIAVTDDKGVNVSCPKTELDAGTNMTCTGSATAIAGNYTNIGTVTSSHDLTASDSANYVGIVPTIRICHASGSHTNPYIVNNPSASGDLNGHAGHTGPIWTPGITVEWGDIIPPFTYYNGVEFPGVNWSAYGEAVYNNNCVIPHGQIIVKKVLSPASNSNQAFEIVGSGTPAIEGTPTFLYESNSNIGSISRNQSHTYNVMPGTYNIEETVPAGWSLVSNACSNITITNNETKECIITNTQDGSLTIVKKALPFGTDTFGFTLTGGNEVNEQFNLVDNSATEDASKTFSLKAGRYAVAENDYSSDWNTTHSCTDGKTIDNIVLNAGENVTCTFTNTKYGSISGYKYEDADNSDETTTDRTPVSGWTIILKDKDGVEIKRTTTNASGYYEFTGLLPADYIVTEGLQVGWIVLIGASKNVTLDAGEKEENVNFVNVKLGSIKVLKNVDKNGDGDLEDSVDVIGSSEWNWTLNGTNAGATGTTKSDLEPGTYTIKETGGLDNYHFVSLSCTGAADKRITILDDTATIDLKSGEDVVCTYRNARNLGKLIIEKEVINDNGGSKKATNFSFQIGSEDPIQFTQNGENELLGRNEYTRYAGLSYTITEVEANQDGYTTTYNNCENIVVPHNGQVVCKITNNDVAPTLTVIKKVVNDNGGTAVISDFEIKLNNELITFGEGVVEGTTTTYTSTPTVVSNTQYSLSEEDLAGYAEGTWSCVENLATVQKPIAMPFTLSEGQNVTCTVTNNDIAPSLQLVKEVNNNYGGEAKVTDWTLTATGPTTISGDGGVTSGNDFKAGTYTLSESGDVTGYNASSWSCTNGVTVDANNGITLGVGESTVCTIINSDIQPKLTVIKVVENGTYGDKKVSDFTLYVGNTEVISGTSNGFNAGDYIVREDNLDGYVATISGACDEKGKVTLNPGDDKTCTITNRSTHGKIIIKKLVEPNTDTTTFDFTGAVEGTIGHNGELEKIVVPRDYSVAETFKSGWNLKSLKCDDADSSVSGYTANIKVGDNETVTCTFTNEKLGKISGYKYEDKNGNGVWDEGEQALKDWTINNGLGDSTTTNDDGYYEFINLPVGNTYTITETLQPGWTQTSTTPSAITIVAGDDIKDINFGNFKHVTINVTKNVVGIDEETDVEDDTTFTAQLNGGNEKLISETTTATYTIEQPGTYTISEFDVVDYTYLGCFLGDAKFTDYAVESGQTYDVVCKNAQLPATLIVTKDVVNSEGEDVDGDIFSDDQFDVVLGEETQQIADTANGKKLAIFEGLQPGVHTFTETPKEGYTFGGCTDDGEVTLGSNQTLEVECINKVIDPLLNIEKSNDKQHIDQYAGDIVTYTITVTAPDDKAEGTYVLNDVIVSDIAPAGFKYLSGTWTAQKNGVDIPVTEPTYDDKGQAKWDIGDMKEGDVVVLTYKTKISLLQNPGNYPDIAWVSGKSIIDGDVLGASTVDPLTPFVGTDVTVIEPVETEEGEVLGASITLPVTGASTYLTLGALIMMILGVITLLLKPFKKLSYALLTGLMAVSFVSLLTPNRVLALDSDIKVRIMQPATPTNKSSFNVGFVALDLNNNSITVECYKDAEVTPFATFIANTGNCPVTVSASGTYTFFVKAKSASGEQKSADVTVVVDLEKPAPVIDYSKAGNVIKFKTPNDGKTKKVEIHRSTTSKYTANEGTRVHTMDVLPNTEYSWTDTTAEAGKTYYYALRTVDALGNVSTIVSDPEVVEVPTVSTSTATTTTTTTAATTGEVAGEKDTAEEGEVAGETDDVLEGEDKEVEKTEDEEEKTDIKETAKKAAGKWYIWVIAIVVIGGVAYYVRRQKRN